MEARRRLWLIGGTQESRWLARAMLVQLQTLALPRALSPLLVSVTTETARHLYPDSIGISLWVGRLRPEDSDAFIDDQRVGAILDMSHPFATEISQRAIALARHHRLPYLRYERPAAPPPDAGPDWQDRLGRPGNIVLPQLSAVLTGPYLCNERTLLTLGYRALSQFRTVQDQGTLYVRILPSLTALTAALEAGFPPNRILACRPPFSQSFEKALWQQWQITQVVTKAAGSGSQETQKMRLAAELGIRLIRLARPSISYPIQTGCLRTAMKFALQFCVKQAACNPLGEVPPAYFCH